MITILRQYVASNIWVVSWRSRSQHDLEAKSCPPHNLVIWSLILKLFHRSDHHIKSPCREQHLGRYLEGQGHTKSFRSITLLFEVRFYNYLTEFIINSNKQELTIIKELFERPVRDYCIVHNTIKCLFITKVK